MCQQKRATVHPGFEAGVFRQWVDRLSPHLSDVKFIEGRERPAYSSLIQPCSCGYRANCTVYRLEREQPVKR